MIYYVVVRNYKTLGYLPLASAAYVHGNKIHAHSATFPDIPNDKAVIDTAADLVISTDTAYETNHGDNEYDNLKAAKIDLIAKLDENADEVNKVANGNKAIIELAGFKGREETVVTPKEKFEAEPGPVRGSIKLTCIKEDKELTVIWLQFPGKNPPEDFNKYSFLKASSKNITIARGFETGDVINVIGAVVRTNSDEDLVWSEPIRVAAR